MSRLPVPVPMPSAFNRRPPSPPPSIPTIELPTVPRLSFFLRPASSDERRALPIYVEPPGAGAHAERVQQEAAEPAPEYPDDRIAHRAETEFLHEAAEIGRAHL